MNRYLYLDADEIEPVMLPIAGADVGLYVARCPGKESANEDAAGVWELPGVGLVLAIADGLGGMPSGARASALAIGALDRALESVSESDSLRSALLDAFEAAHREIVELGIGAGTTLIVAEICDRRLRIYHVGDSAAFVVGQRGKLKLETLPHSPVGYGVAAGLIHPEQALEREDRHFITNYLGSSEMHIQVGSPIELALRDSLLISSDGLLDNLLPSEIYEMIRKGSVSANAAALAQLAGRRMQSADRDAPSKPDDMSFILHRTRARV